MALGAPGSAGAIGIFPQNQHNRCQSHGVGGLSRGGRPERICVLICPNVFGLLPLTFST